MRSRYPSTSSFASSFGPGPVTPAIKAIMIANAAAYIVALIVPPNTLAFGLRPADVVGQFHLWQIVTYMFLHGGIFHILFNMLALWMFGAELERIWGTRYFLKFYFVTGGGAAILTVIFSYVFSLELQGAVIIGASGAIYGLLLAYALYFPERPIYMYFVFPIPAKYFVLIMGALAFYSSIADSGGVAHATHLGGLVVGYFLLKGVRLHPWAEVKYRYLKWRIMRARKRFDVYQGGRPDDWNRRVH
jgi:membrane associated rhomboid family serine protease